MGAVGVEVKAWLGLALGRQVKDGVAETVAEKVCVGTWVMV